MSQVITNAFEQYWQSSLAAEQPVVLDEFILADIPNLDITAPIDPDTVLPPESQIVHRQNVDQRGRINSNAVAYSIVMDTTVGDFSFNAMFLRNKANGVIGMIVYKGRETKLKTDQTTGQTGNSLVKSMLMGYDQAAEATLTNVDAGTWQIDYAARLRGQDEDLRQLASQLYGHHTFIGDGFKVVQQAGGHQVTPGVAIVGGLRIELKQPQVIYPGTKPIGVWVDVHRSGSLLSEHQNHVTIITSVADLTDHVDGNGYQHYVAKLGTVQADSTVIDGRGQDGSGGSGAIPDTFALWKRSMAEAGYDLIGQFGTKIIIQNAKQAVLSKDGTKVYQWQGALPKSLLADSTPENTGGTGPSAWTDRSTAPISFKVISVVEHGASPTATSAVNTSAFLDARAEAGPGGVVYVPPGAWKLTNPFDLGEQFMVYGRGAVLVFDKAEWRRRGGSAGTLRSSEQYTLFYEHTGNDADIHVFVNSTEVPWTWFSTNTIDVPAAAPTTTADTVSYYIANGRHRLGGAPEDINGYCSDLAGGSVMQTDYQSSAVAGGPAYNNLRVGSRAGYNLTTGGNNTYAGTRAGASNNTSGNNSAFGFQSLYRNIGDGNSVFGSIAMEWAIDSNNCCAFGLGALGSLILGSNNTAMGAGSLSIRAGDGNSVVGFEAHNRVGFERHMGATTTMGTYAGNYHWGDNNCLFGYAAGRGEVDGTTGTGFNSGTQNTFVGYFAGAKASTASHSVAIGAGAGSAAKTAQNFTAVGFEAGGQMTTGGNGSFFGYHAGYSSTVGDVAAFGANALEFNVTGIRASAFGTRSLNNSLGNDNSAFGFEAGTELTSGTENSFFGIWAGQHATTSSGNTSVGSRAGQSLTTGGFNVNVGRQSGLFLVDGANNTNIGASAGRLSQDGTNAISWVNSSCIGNDSRVSGSNQVQIGNSTTTTYTYGTVQNRSDIRDKADIQDTVLGIDFIMGLRPVDGRWDMRDDYIQIVPDAPEAPEAPEAPSMPEATTPPSETEGPVAPYEPPISLQGQGTEDVRIYHLDGDPTNPYSRVIETGDSTSPRTHVIETGSLEPSDYSEEDYQRRLAAYQEECAAYETKLMQYQADLVRYESDLADWEAECAHIQEHNAKVATGDGRDGRKARTRKHHWFIAQEVKELCDTLGVEFGGYQDHLVNGGCDVQTLGYDEFIPPMTKAIQDCWGRINSLESRLLLLETGQ